MTEESPDVRIPAPPPPAPQRLLAVGHHGPSSVDAEDFSRRVGNWGGASQRIGDRWEALVPELLGVGGGGRRAGPWMLPAGGGRTLAVVAVLGLDADPEAGPALQRAGVSAPDFLLVATGGGIGGRPMLRASDCKVSLDTADPAQTAPARLQATFARVAAAFPAVAAALRRQVAALPGAGQRDGAREVAGVAVEGALAGRWEEVVAGEGLFIAPDNGFNRWFVSRLEAHRRTGAPLGRLPASGPRRIPGEGGSPYLASHLEPVTAATFLAPLAGWPEASVVAELDGVDPLRVDLVVAERCWRVGAGLRGAVLALRRPLFRPALPETRPDGTPREVTPGLRQLLARRRLADSGVLVGAVAHSLDVRRPSWEREGELLRPPLTYPAWIARVREWRQPGGGPERGEEEVPGGGPALGAETPAEEGERATGRELYRELGLRHRRRVLAAAAELEGSVSDEGSLLDALEARQPEWREALLADAAELARRMM
jgi:hypothetical protein